MNRAVDAEITADGLEDADERRAAADEAKLHHEHARRAVHERDSHHMTARHPAFHAAIAWAESVRNA